MSDNSYIRIGWEKTRYEVTHRDADTGHTFQKIGKAGTLEEAVDIANKFQKEWPTEYGLFIKTKPKVKSELKEGE